MLRWGLFAVVLASAPASAVIVYDKPLAVETHILPAAPGQLAETYVCRRFAGFVSKSVRWEDRSSFDDHFVQPYRGATPPCRPEAPWTPSSVIGAISGVLGRFIVRESVYESRDSVVLYDTATAEDLLTRRQSGRLNQ